MVHTQCHNHFASTIRGTRELRRTGCAHCLAPSRRPWRHHAPLMPRGLHLHIALLVEHRVMKWSATALRASGQMCASQRRAARAVMRVPSDRMCAPIRHAWPSWPHYSIAHSCYALGQAQGMITALVTAVAATGLLPCVSRCLMVRTSTR